MYEPYGYTEENEYISKKAQIENELAFSRYADKKEFTSVEYNSALQSFVFRNIKGTAVGQANMKDIIAQELLDASTTYDKTKKAIVLVFKSGQTVEIPVDDLIDVIESGDGLITVDDKFNVLADANTEKSRVNNIPYLTVGPDGVNVSGINLAVEKEEERAIAEETRLDNKIDAETSRAIGAERALNDLIIAEQNRAITEETRIDKTIGTGFTTASTETVTQKFINLNNGLAQEISNRTTQDNQLQNNINVEITAREAEISRLEARIRALEQRI